MFSSEYCKIFNNTYFEEHLLTAAPDFFKIAAEQHWAAAFVLALFLSSDNLLTGYEQLSCKQFNQNFSLAKDWFMLHKKFSQEDLAT